MAWQANIQRTERNGNELDIIVEYYNGTNVYDQTIQTYGSQTPVWISNQVYNTIQQLNNLDKYQASITPGSITPIAPTPSVGTPSTKTVLFGSVQDILGTVQQIKQLIQYGVIGTADISSLGSIQTNLKSIFINWFNS